MHRYLLARISPEPMPPANTFIYNAKAATADNLDALGQDDLAALLMQELEQEN